MSTNGTATCGFTNGFLQVEFSHRSSETTPTRGKNMLGLCLIIYLNHIFKKKRPPVGLLDQNVILLLPNYRSQIKTEGTFTKDIRIWTVNAPETPRSCFELIDWGLFFLTTMGMILADLLYCLL